MFVNSNLFSNTNKNIFKINFNGSDILDLNFRWHSSIFQTLGSIKYIFI